MVALTNMNPRWKDILDVLPENQWNVVKAAIQVGYAKSYAERKLKVMLFNDVQFCSALDALRAKVTAKSLKGIELAQKKLTAIMLNEDTSTMNMLRAIDITCKIAGVYSEKRVFEDAHRTKELEQSERREAQLLADMRLRLPCPTYSDAAQDVVGDSGRQGTPTAHETEDKQDGNKQDSPEPE
jgi:hypothetical protein